MQQSNATPSGFSKHAQEFFEAAVLVFDQADSVSLPGYFLLGRSIELSLKAYLLYAGVPISKLRSKKLGHNLRPLLDLAREKGINDHVALAPIEEGVLRLLDHDYSEKRFDYRETDATYHIPLQAPTAEVARKLAFDIEALQQQG